MKEKINYWLVKQDPAEYSWADLLRDGHTSWTGVRNSQARNNLRWMKVGDQVLLYHSGKDKAVRGMAQVIRAAYPDPTAEEAWWVAVDLKPVRALLTPVRLEMIRRQESLREIPLIKQARLSVMPLSNKEFDAIISLGG